MSVKQETIYVKIDQNVVCSDRNVTLSDVAKMECTNQAALRQIKQKKLYSFPREQQEKVWIKGQAAKKQLQVFSFLKVIELIHEDYPDLDVVNEGEKDDKGKQR